MGNVTNLRTGQVTVNTTAVQVCPSNSTLAASGILISALASGSGNIYVGTSGVTASSGLEIVKGNPPVFIPLEWPTDLYAIGSGSGNTLTYAII